MNNKSVYIIAVALITVSCNKKVNRDPVPSILYNGISPRTVTNGFVGDTVTIKFVVNDGDADLGNGVDATNHDIFVKDSRSSTGEEQKFYFPNIPKDAVLENKSMQVYTSLNLDAPQYFVLRPDRPNGDTLTFEIYVKDRAGNKSNIITTEPIYIQP